MFIKLLWLISINLFAVLSLYGDSPLTQDKIVAKEVYQEFLSPYCPGRSLADCPSNKAKELKLKILTDLESGKTKTEVLSDLEIKYGKELNANPGLSGLGIWVWLIPGVFLLLAVYLIRKWVRNNLA